MNYRFDMPLISWQCGGRLVAGALVAALAIASTARAAELRTWTSASGSHTTEAEFVELKDDGNVVLKTKAGKTIEVAVGKLSAADQAFVRAKGAAKPPATADTETVKSPEQLEAEAQQCHTAKEAVLLYKFYLSKRNLSAEQRAAAD